MEDNTYVIQGPKPYEPIPDETLGVLFWNILISLEPDNILMINAHNGKKLTSEQLLQESCNLAQALRIQGCDGNTMLGICSENTLEYFIPVCASIFAGTVLVPINHSYTLDELEHALAITEPSIIFVSKNTYRNFVELKKTLTFIKRIIVIDSKENVPEVETLSQFVNGILPGKSVLPIDFKPFDGDPRNQTAIILSSSGTTGLPKGVMLTHRNLMTRMLQSRDPQYLTDRRIVLGLMPFFHAYGLIFGLSSILNNHVTVMIDQFEEDLFLESIERYRISVLRIVPPLAIFLAKTPKISQYDLSSVGEIFCAAAPLSGETEKKLKQRLNIKTIQQAYGCTEGTLALTFMNKYVYKPGSCGQVVTYMICKVRDPETGQSLPAYKVGELCFKGPSVMKGYYRNDTATQESFTSDGWLRTGDLGFYDKEEYFYIIDRLKEVIKYKGYQVPPAELEAILVHHPDILDAGVVGLPDEIAGELPLAFVVKKLGAKVSAAELKRYVAAKVSPQKRLRGGVIFVSSIPKNPSGKILRKELKKRASNFQSQHDSKL